MQLPYTESDEWPIKVRIVYATRGSPESQVKVFHITHYLILLTRDDQDRPLP